MSSLKLTTVLAVLAALIHLPSRRHPDPRLPRPHPPAPWPFTGPFF